MNQSISLPRPEERYGFWATLGFSGVIVGVYLAVLSLVIGVFLGIEQVQNPDLDQDSYLKSLMKSGFFLSIATLVSAWVVTLATGAIVLLKKNISLRDYLGVRHASIRVYAGWLGVTGLFLAGWSVLGQVINAPGSDWMVATYQTAEYLPLLWVAMVVGAPLLEETFYRGFVFEGFRDSRLGPVGAVLVTSTLWAATHVQYPLFQKVMLGLFGILLGFAKVKTRSLYVPFAMHAFLNLVAMAQLTMWLP